VIVDAQRALLTAAVAAGVPRSIPFDYRQIALGSNRNFEVRREFAADLDAAPIQATSILNGAFVMLTGTAPMIAFGRRKVMFWSSADQVLNFTTKDDVARVVARVALDADAPRVVEVAGDRVTAPAWIRRCRNSPARQSNCSSPAPPAPSRCWPRPCATSQRTRMRPSPPGRP
jgi:hypothetical protein